MCGEKCSAFPPKFCYHALLENLTLSSSSSRAIDFYLCPGNIERELHTVSILYGLKPNLSGTNLLWQDHVSSWDNDKCSKESDTLLDYDSDYTPLLFFLKKRNSGGNFQKMRKENNSQKSSRHRFPPFADYHFVFPMLCVVLPWMLLSVLHVCITASVNVVKVCLRLELWLSDSFCCIVLS